MMDLREMVEMANATGETLKGKGIDAVRELVDAADVAIGVFQDPTKPHGVGTHVIKGHRLLTKVLAERDSKRVAMVCIPCRELEEAIALQQVVGEPDALN